jgi:hypothetical protein
MFKMLVEIKATVEMQNSLPPQVLPQQPVIVNDAPGRIWPFHLETIDSLQMFTALLRAKFQDFGCEKIIREEFRLDDATRNREINWKVPWQKEST